MWNDDDSGANEWDLQGEDEEQEDNSSGRPTIIADRVRSAASSGGRTSSNSHYSVDGFDYAYTRGMDYAEISQELAHIAVWSSLEQQPTQEAAEASRDLQEQQQRKAPSDEAWDVEPDPDDITKEAAGSPEPAFSDEPLSLVEGDADEDEAPFMILQKVPGDFRFSPAHSWATLHAPFRPAGHPQANLRIAPADEIVYTISGPLGATAQMMDSILAKGSGATDTIQEDPEEGEVAYSPKVGGDFRHSPKATWNALHAPFFPSGKEEVREAPEKPAEAAPEASAEPADKERRPSTADVLDGALADESVKGAVETPAEAPSGAASAVEPRAAEPLPATGGVAVACAAEMEENADVTAPEKPEGSGKPLEEVPEEKLLPEASAAYVEETVVAPVESDAQVAVETTLPVEEAEPVQATLPVAVSTPVLAEAVTEQEHRQELAEEKDIEPPVEVQVEAAVETQPAECPSVEINANPVEERSAEKNATEVPAESSVHSAAVEQVMLGEMAVPVVSKPPSELPAEPSPSEAQTGTPMEASLDTIESAQALPSKDVTAELLREAELDEQTKTAADEEASAQVRSSADAVDLAAEPAEAKAEEPPADISLTAPAETLVEAGTAAFEEAPAQVSLGFVEDSKPEEAPAQVTRGFVEDSGPEEAPAQETLGFVEDSRPEEAPAQVALSVAEDSRPEETPQDARTEMPSQEELQNFFLNQLNNKDAAHDSEADDNMPTRVAPAESLDEEYGSPLGKTAQVLNSMQEAIGVDPAESSTETVAEVNVKYASPHELTADPGEIGEATEATSKEDAVVKDPVVKDPIVKRRTSQGLEHEAWVASVFGSLAAEVPLDRPVRKPGMKRMSTISIARALGCVPAMQQIESSPSVARDSHMAHAGTNSIRSPLSSAPMSSQPRSLWTPPSPPAPSSIRSQGSSELPKVPQLVSMPATGFRLSPSTSANSELASAARRCRSAVPGLDMTKVHMGYDDDEDTEDDHTSTLFKTHKGLEASENTPTSGAKKEVPTLNMAVLQKKYSAGHSNKLTHESSGPRYSVTSPPAPRGVPAGNAKEELGELPPRPSAPTPRAANQVDGRENLRPPSRGDNMVMGRPFDYWRGGKLQRRATCGAMEEGAFARLPQRPIASAGGFGLGTSSPLEMMPHLERRAVSASELHRPVPLDQPILKGYSSQALSSLSPAGKTGVSPSAFAASNSVPSLPNAVRDPAAPADSNAQGNVWDHDQWTLDAIGCVVADKKMPLNAPAVVRLPPVAQKKPFQKWQVGTHPVGFGGMKRSKATIISHTHVHHHHHYHVKRPAAAAADIGSGVPVAGAVSM